MFKKARPHSYRKWIQIIILVSVGLGMVVFFGYNRTERPNSQYRVLSEPLAKVNGDPISVGKLKALLDVSSNIPRDLNLVKDFLNQWIEIKLFAQEAKKAGFQISDQELAEKVFESHRSFNPDGSQGPFNRRAYEIKLKAFHQVSGENYEDSLRELFLASRFQKWIADTAEVSDDELKDEFIATHTELNLQRIVIPESLPMPSSLPESFAASGPSIPFVPFAASEPSTETKAETLEDARFVETLILDLLNAERASWQVESRPDLPPESLPASQTPVAISASLETLQKRYGLKISETGFYPLKYASILIGDQNATDALQCLVHLSPEKPFCAKAYTIRGQKVFFRLIGRQNPDFLRFDSVKDELKASVLVAKKQLIVQTMRNALLKKAEIKIFLTPENFKKWF